MPPRIRSFAPGERAVLVLRDDLVELKAELEEAYEALVATADVGEPLDFEDVRPICGSLGALRKLLGRQDRWPEDSDGCKTS